MLLGILLNLLMVSVAFASNPIVLLKPSCPKSVHGKPMLSVIADIPTHAMARCQNGDSPLLTMNDVHFKLSGTFEPLSFAEDCLFFKNDSYSYWVDVEVRWAERSRQKIFHQEIHTVSCIYNEHGMHVPSPGSSDHWFISPKSAKSELSPPSNKTTTPLSLKVLDEGGREIFSRISAGRIIKLVAEGNVDSSAAFQAVDCEATNGVNSQAILEAGCGNGFIFKKSEGFSTLGTTVVSPYFKAFNLPGGDSVTFSCRFTVCHSACDGDSCRASVGRRKRSLLDIITASFVSVTSGPVFLNPMR